MLLVVTDERFADHVAGVRHPERPDRLGAALEGVHRPAFAEGLEFVAPRAVTEAEILAVHTPELLETIRTIDRAGGGHVDADTAMSAASLDAAYHAAGAVLTAVEGLEADPSRRAAYCVVRPPGHHATRGQSMWFCLFNSVAITATALADAGHRVAIVDIDAHHGNGTQEVFVDDPRVFFASIHQSPLYPGTGAIDERGVGTAVGTTVNVPLPPGATGDVALQAIDEVIGPMVDAFAPDWLLVSAGYDAHRADPLTHLGYSAGDYADLLGRLVPLVGPGRVVVVLEGGYDLDAVRESSAAVTGVLLDVVERPEAATSGGPGAEVVELARRLHLAGEAGAEPSPAEPGSSDRM